MKFIINIFLFLSISSIFTALGYDTKTFKTMYYTLKVLRWKIRNAKDKNGKFLFATWQLNWQL